MTDGKVFFATDLKSLEEVVSACGFNKAVLEPTPVKDKLDADVERFFGEDLTALPINVDFEAGTITYSVRPSSEVYDYHYESGLRSEDFED